MHTGNAPSCWPLTHATNYPSESSTSSATRSVWDYKWGAVASSKALLSALPSSTVDFLPSITPPPKNLRMSLWAGSWVPLPMPFWRFYNHTLANPRAAE